MTDAAPLAPSAHPFQTLLFDLDGTLVHTAPDLALALNHTLGTIGLAPLALEKVIDLVGDGARALLSRGLGDRLGEHDMEELFQTFLDFYGDNVARSSRPYEGVPEALAAFARENRKLAVCTNKPAGLSDALLQELGLRNYFQSVIGGDSLPVKKPDPEHVLATIRAVGGDLDTTVMIGDSSNDVNAAKAAGVKVVAVSFGYTSIPARDLGADITIDHFHDLPAALAAIGNN